MMSSSSGHSIQLACQAMDNAIARYIKKQSKRGKPISTSNESRAKEAANHFKYVVEQLFRKRTSLEFAVQAFTDVCCNDCINALDSIIDKGSSIVSSRISAQQSYVNADQVRFIFSHWMGQCVRLQDCFVLLQSGECRHATDVALCRSSVFKSRFGGDLLRNDGYTSMYSAKYYSGYGWDELFDDDVGIKSRITSSLGGHSKDKQTRIWNEIMDNALLLDTVLNEYEQSIKCLFQKFEKFREDFVQSIKNLLAAHNGFTSTIRLSMVDKLERLEILNAKPLYIKTLRIERQADSFQVQDPGGVLPLVYTYADWKSKMMLPELSNERILEDSESIQQSNESTIGLKTTIKYANDELKRKLATDSVRDIKYKLGINAETLEASRERLEDEVKMGLAGKNEQETHDMKKRSGEEQRVRDTDAADIEKEIFHCTQELLMYRKKLEGETDKDVIWNTKEFIRDNLMTLGLLHLELYNESGNSEENSNATYLQDAINFFVEELKLIQELEFLNQGCNNLTSVKGGDLVTHRTLCSLRGWAHGNLGIAHLNVALSSSSEGETQRRHFEVAVEQLALANDLANAIRSWCNHDRANSSYRVHQESLIHRICASELESFANRWSGVALWKLGNQRDAAKALENASACFINPPGDMTNRVHEAYVSLLTQRCSAAVQFADLAATEADKCFVACSSRKATDRTQKKKEGDKFISVAVRAYRRGLTIIQEMNDIGRKCKAQIVKGNSVPTEDLLRAKIKELEERQTLLKATEDVNLENLVNGIRSRLHGNDVPSRWRTAHYQGPPTKFIAITPSLRHTKNRRVMKPSILLPLPFVEPGPGTEVYEGKTSETLLPIRYRKWGDQLLPKSPDGGVLYEYPGCCPPLPSELQLSNII